MQHLSLLGIPLLHLSWELLPQLPELPDGLEDDDKLDEEASGLKNIFNKIWRVLVHQRAAFC